MDGGGGGGCRSLLSVGDSLRVVTGRCALTGEATQVGLVGTRGAVFVVVGRTEMVQLIFFFLRTVLTATATHR